MKVLITGGSRGIGKAIKDKFILNSHEVYSPTRDELDLKNQVILKSAEFDIIINNAGINPLNSILDMNQEEVMRVNYYSPLDIIRQCIPYMIEKNYGRIVNIGSIWINLSKEKRAAYSASKNALDSLTRSIVAEYGKYNILCNTISPGFILTDLTKKNNTEEELKIIAKNIPVGRLGTPEEIADLVYNLTINNNYLAGQNIIIDGGFTCIP